MVSLVCAALRSSLVTLRCSISSLGLGLGVGVDLGLGMHLGLGFKLGLGSDWDPFSEMTVMVGVTTRENARIRVRILGCYGLFGV